MFLLYADESGDVGRLNGSSKYFALSGLVLHELRWHDFIDEILEFRRHLRKTYGLKLREEIHASHMLHKPGSLARIPKSIRLRILREVIDFQNSLSNISIINVVVDKTGKRSDYDVFDHAWRALIQRFHNTLSRRNFPGPQNPQDRGLIIVDETDEKKLRLLTRKMSTYNPVSNRGGGGYRNIPINTLVEDAIHRNSLQSYIIQLCDVNAYLLYQHLSPNAYVKRKGGRNYFLRLDSLLCKLASSSDPLGIVRL